MTPYCILVTPQGAYSSAVYGAPGRVDLHALRIVYLNLLSDAAVRNAAP